MESTRVAHSTTVRYSNLLPWTSVVVQQGNTILDAAEVVSVAGAINRRKCLPAPSAGEASRPRFEQL